MITLLQSQNYCQTFKRLRFLVFCSVKNTSLLILVFSVQFAVIGQSSFWHRADTLHKGRLIGTSISIGTVWAGTMTGLGAVWYDGVEKTSWHSFDDSRNWMQMDKAGHFYTGYKINQLTTDLYLWSGLDQTRSTLIGAGISFGYQTTLEMLDAYSADWGFSWADFGSNVAGIAAYSTQQLVWKEERIIPKFSFHPTDYAELRPEVLGSNFMESLLKDYNGQTYWLSVNPSTFFEHSKLPKWLCFSFGYSVDKKMYGDSDVFQSGTETLYAQRQYLFSLDVDFSRIQTRHQWLHVILKQLNYLKVPFPALLLSDGKMGFKPFYF